MELYYTTSIAETQGTLSADEAHHCYKVMRHKPGDELWVTDGMGWLYRVAIQAIDQRACSFTILEKENHRSTDAPIHIAIAPPKNIDRFEWFLEKATEMGISEITPLRCDNSERTVIKPERLEKILLSAMKQSLDYNKPRLNELTSFSDFCKNNKGTIFFAHCDEGTKTHLAHAYRPHSAATILIGPEGDFSPKEIALARKMQFTEISLGDKRLRTETAGLVACHCIHVVNAINEQK